VPSSFPALALPRCGGGTQHLLRLKLRGAKREDRETLAA
jgi:hypothetical protein